MKKSTKTEQINLKGVENSGKVPTEKSENRICATPHAAHFGRREYQEVWESIREAATGESFFSGHLSTLHASFASHLTATLIIHHTTGDPEGEIERVVPVWWELECYTLDDEPQLLEDDFSFADLAKHLKA